MPPGESPSPVNSSFDYDKITGKKGYKISSDSSVGKILKHHLGNNYNNKKRVIVNCNNQKITNCDPVKKPCLFDISKDPCEHNNIADRLPDIVEELTILLGKYNMTAVPPNNTPNKSISSYSTFP